MSLFLSVSRVLRKRGKILLPFLPFLFSSCKGVDLSTQNLTHPEILMIRSDPSALIPPAKVTAAVRVFDPERRTRGVHWYLPLGFDLYDLETFARSTNALRDPGKAGELGFLYLGSGFEVELLIPSLPIGEGRESLPFDSFPLPLFVVLDQGEVEVPLKGLKRLRIVIPDLVAKHLTRELGRPPSAEELDQALRIRLNRSPEITGVTLLQVPQGSPYPRSAMEDLAIRRGLSGEPLLAPLLLSGQGLRLIPHLEDPDLATNPERGQPGFNYLTVTYLSPEGEFFALTPTSSDWVPQKLSFSSPFESPEEVPITPGLKTFYLIAFDHQGGVTATALDLGLGDFEPPPYPDPATLAYLFENRGRLLWLYSATPLTFSALEPGTVTISLYPQGGVPLGVTGVVVPSPPQGILADLDLVERDPLRFAKLPSPPFALTGRWLRLFTRPE